MSWIVTPTFTDGNVLSATQLNSISDNIEYLYGQATAPEMAFGSLHVTSQSLDQRPANNTWYIRHRYRYLHYNIAFGSAPTNARIYYNYPTYSTFADPALGTSSPQIGYIDLYSANNNALRESLIVKRWYEIRLEITGTPSSITVQYLIESDSTSLAPI